MTTQAVADGIYSIRLRVPVQESDIVLFELPPNLNVTDSSSAVARAVYWLDRVRKKVNVARKYSSC
jgi:type IV secretory pathway protease TraF